MTITPVPTTVDKPQTPRDVLVRAARTFVQTFLPSATVAYAHYQQHSGLITPVLAAGGVSGAAAGLAVLWNGLTILLGAHRANQLKAAAADAAAFEAAVIAAVAHAAQTGGVVPGTVVPPTP